MKEKAFITKKELCNRWSISPDCLRKWLQDPDCLKELEQNGYRKTQKLLTLKQLEIILKHFE